jgi:hypothetical protein
MRTDDNSASLDRYEEGEDPELFGLDGAASDPLDRPDDPDAEPDEALLEAELGAHDIAVEEDLDLTDEPDDDPTDDQDDDHEVALLQELGIDLDAPDAVLDGLDLLTDDDDEVAA